MGVVKRRSPFGTVDCLGERWDDKRHGRQDNSGLAPLPLDSFRRSSLSLPLPSIMNQQQPAASSQPGASLYMGQRLEMEYLCAGPHPSHILLRTILNLSSQQIVARKTRSDPVNRSAAENADTGSCTRNAPRGVSVFLFYFCRRLLITFPATGSGPI